MDPALAELFKEFSFTTGFDVERFVSDVFRDRPYTQAADLKENLQRERARTSEDLRAYVWANYQRFVEASRAIVSLESELAQLSSALGEYRVALKGLSELSFRDGAAAAASAAAAATAAARSAASPNASARGRRGSADGPKALRTAARRKSRSGAGGDGGGGGGGGEGGRETLRALAEELGGLVLERRVEEATACVLQCWDALEDAGEGEGAVVGASAVEGGGGGSGDSDTDAIRREVDASVAQLCDLLRATVGRPSLPLHERKEAVDLLVRLRQGASALEAFLLARSQALRAEIRKIRVSGDIVAYVSELSQVAFRAVATGALEFEELFEDRAMASHVTAWAVDEVTDFCGVLQRHLFQGDSVLDKVAAALKLVFAACRTLEKRGVGLSLSFVLVRVLLPSMRDAVGRYYQRLETQLQRAIAGEAWRASEFWVHAKKGARAKASRCLRLTDSAKLLYDATREVLHTVAPLLDTEAFASGAEFLYSAVVGGYVALCESCLLHMAQHAKTPHLGAAQGIAIVGNVFTLTEDLLPRVGRELRKRALGSCPELDTLTAKVRRLYDALRDAFCAQRAAAVVDDLWRFPALAKLYSEGEIAMANAAPSRGLVEAARHFSELARLLDAALGREQAQTTLRQLVAETFRALYHEASYWHALTVRHGGLQQLVLDVRFLLAACAPALDEAAGGAASEAARLVVQRAVAKYATTMNDETLARADAAGAYPSGVLLADEWFAAAIARALEATPPVRFVDTPAASPQQQPQPQPAGGADDDEGGRAESAAAPEPQRRGPLAIRGRERRESERKEE